MNAGWLPDKTPVRTLCGRMVCTAVSRTRLGQGRSEPSVRCLSWVIRVDIAGHYHVRPRPVGLPPSRARSANNGHSCRSSCVLASLDLATRDARRALLSGDLDSGARGVVWVEVW